MHSSCAVVLCALLCGCGKDGPSDEDLLEKFAQDVTGEVDAALVERSLGYVDIERYPVDVRVPRMSGVFNETRAEELIGAYRTGMKRHFWGDTLKLRNTKIEIEGDSARVQMSIRCRYGGLKVDVGLRKPEPLVWKVAKVHVQRSLL